MNGERFARITERAIRCRAMSATDWRTYACIALHAGGSDRAYPGMSTIAEMVAIRRQDVPRVIRRLVRFGLLRYEPGAGPGGSNLYVIPSDGERVSATARTVRNGADGGCPHERGQGVRNAATKVSATVRTKHNKEQNKEHISAGEGESADWFERFLRVYPGRGEHNNPKKPAREKFLAAIKRGVDPELIVKAAGNYAAHITRTNTAPKYVKQAQHWLSAECWEQYQVQPAPAQPKFGGMI